MILRGEIEGKVAEVLFGSRINGELRIFDGDDLVSAYKVKDGVEYYINGNYARDLYNKLLSYMSKKFKELDSMISAEGLIMRREYRNKKQNLRIEVWEQRKEIVFIEIEEANSIIRLQSTGKVKFENSLDNEYRVLNSSRISLLTDLNIKTLHKTLAELKMEKDLSWLDKKNYKIVNDDEEAEKIFRELEEYDGVIAYDTETTGLKINMFCKYGTKEWKFLIEENRKRAEQGLKIARTDKLVGIIFSIRPNESWYFPVNNKLFKNLYEVGSKYRYEILKKFRDALKDKENITEFERYVLETNDDEIPNDVILMLRVRSILEGKHIVTHNGIFEWKVGYIYDIDTNIMDDTMILHQLVFKFRDGSIKGESSALKDLEKREFGIETLELTDFFGKVKSIDSIWEDPDEIRIDFSLMPYEEALTYACADGDYTLQLYHKYKPQLPDDLKDLYNVELRVSRAIGYIEFYGHKIDEVKLKQAEIENLKRIEELEKEFKRLAGVDDSFNMASPVQLARLLFDEKGIRASKRGTSEDVLEEILTIYPEDSYEYKLINVLLEWRKANTIRIKYYKPLQDYMYPGGFVFSSYKQNGAVSGRIISEDPNSQQYPDEIKGIVVPRENCIILDIDFSQIEFRIMVSLAGEERVIEMLKNPDYDFHSLVASLMFNIPYDEVTSKLRKVAKGLSFGIPYGMGIRSIAITIYGVANEETIKEAEEKYNMYFKEMPRLKRFFEVVKEEAKITGYVRTYFGRYRYFNIHDANEVRLAASLRQAGNHVIQGTAADLFKISLARLFTYLKKNDLLGIIYINNIIHDEVVCEVDYTKISPNKALKIVKKCLEFDVPGFTKIFTGAGFGMSWLQAKEDMELHPVLAERLANEEKYFSSADEIIKYFMNEMKKFEIEKLREFIKNLKSGDKVGIGKINNMKSILDISEDELIENKEVFRRFCIEYANDIELDIDNLIFNDEEGHKGSINLVGEVLPNDDNLDDYKRDIVKTFGYLLDRAAKSLYLYIDELGDGVRELDEYISSKVSNDGYKVYVLNSKKNNFDDLGIYVDNISEEAISEIFARYLEGVRF